MLHMQLTQVKIQMIYVNSFIFLKRINYEILFVVKSHCLSLVHALYTLHCTVYEVLRGLIKTKRQEGSTPHSNLVTADQYPTCIRVSTSQTLDSMVCT